MKKYIIYIGILAVGLLLGWLIFGKSSKEETAHKHDSVLETNQIWTCSMHPKIMQPEAGDCPICGMDLIPAESNSEGLLANQFKLSENAMALANIQTSIVGNEEIPENAIKLSGKIVENEETNAVQVSYFSGRIERLYINSTGEKIKKGQLLATIYSPELFATQQELITTASLKETQPKLYKAVRNKLKLLKITENQITKIETSGKIKEDFPVYATVSGTVSEKLVAQGEAIKQGQPLLKIANFSTVWANFDVYENQIDLFKKGQEVIVSTYSYPDKEFKGKVTFIDPVLDTKTRTIKLRVVLNNKEEIFKSGMFVEGKVKGIMSNKNEEVVVPSSAVLWTGKRSVVYVKANPNEPIFEMRSITLGTKTGANYQIIDGLKNGEEIVTNGAFTVDASAQLQGKKSMMNKKGDKTTTGYEDHLMKKEITEKILDASIQKSFFPVINAYLDLKDAFVASDVAATSKKNSAFIKSLELIPITEREKTNKYWSILHKISKQINENTDLVKQRNHFKALSSNLIALISNFNTLENKLFVQFCPMANNNKGAYWLSKKEKIINPYYGEAMLTCGEVKQVLE